MAGGTAADSTDGAARPAAGATDAAADAATDAATDSPAAGAGAADAGSDITGADPLARSRDWPHAYRGTDSGSNGCATTAYPAAPTLF